MEAATPLFMQVSYILPALFNIVFVIHAYVGTTITFGLQVGEMYTSDSGVGVESVTNVGSAQENSFLTIAIVSKTFEHESTVAAGYSYMHSESTERASNTHFEHSYTFEYDLSTSDDPFTAGVHSIYFSKFTCI